MTSAWWWLGVVVAWWGCAGPAVPAPVAMERADTNLAFPQPRVGVDAAAGNVVLYLGPFDVPSSDAGGHGEHGGHGEDDDPASTRPMLDFAWPVDGWLRGLAVRVETAEGQLLPRALLHHMIIYNLERPQLVHPGVERLIGMGRETGDIRAPASVGVPLSAGTRLAARVSWHNESGTDLRHVYVRVELPYTAQRAGGIPYAGRPMYVDAHYETGTPNAFDLPPGRSTQRYEFTMPLDGGLIGVGGHLHDYGVEVRLEDAETGRVLFRLHGIRDGAGHILRVERRVFRSWFGLKDARLRLEAGHRYRVVGVYDNPTGQVIHDGGMAHFTGLFAPADGAAWPALDLDDPLVQLDIAVLRGQVREHRAGEHAGH